MASIDHAIAQASQLDISQNRGIYSASFRMRRSHSLRPRVSWSIRACCRQSKRPSRIAGTRGSRRIGAEHACHEVVKFAKERRRECMCFVGAKSVQKPRELVQRVAKRRVIGHGWQRRKAARGDEDTARVQRLHAFDSDDRSQMDPARFARSLNRKMQFPCTLQRARRIGAVSSESTTCSTGNSPNRTAQ